MKLLCFFQFFFIIYISPALAQKLNINTKVGIANISLQNDKVFALYRGADIGCEKILKKDVLALRTNAGFYTNEYHQMSPTAASNASVTNSLLMASLSVRLYAKVSNSTILFFEPGIANHYLFRVKSEIFTANGKLIDISNPKNYNLGISGYCGTLFRLNCNLNILVGLSGHRDFSSSAKLGNYSYKASTMLLTIGLGWD